jgi:hypothetical protein
VGEQAVFKAFDNLGKYDVVVHEDENGKEHYEILGAQGETRSSRGSPNIVDPEHMNLTDYRVR